MNPGPDDTARLAVGTALDPAFIIDLTLSVDAGLVWRIDFSDDSPRWTPGLDALLGAPGLAEREVGERLREAVSPMFPAARNAPAGEDFELERRFPGPDDHHPRWVRFRARTYDTGFSTGLFGVASDVTEQREARQALADLADRYRLLVDLSPEAIAVHQHGHVVYVNPAYLRFFRAPSSAEVLGRPITDFVHPDSVPGLWSRIRSLTTPGATSDPAEAELLRFDGTTVTVESVSVRTTWEGEPAYQVIMRDITAQKAAGAALRYQAALVSHVTDAIIATDSGYVVTSWNPAAEAIYGHPAAEAIGRDVSELIGARLDLDEVMRTGGVLRGVHRRTDGTELTVRISAASMDTGYVLVCSDETAQRRAERYFATVVASLEEGVLVVTPNGRIESANPAALRILDLPSEEVVGRRTPLANLFDEEGRALPEEEYPLTTTRLSGTPQNSRLLRMRRRDGSDAWLSLSCRPLDPDSDPPHSVVTSFSDNTERRTIAERLKYDATHDALTGLANRSVVVSMLAEALGVPHRNEIAVLFIDLDKFKVINDSLGHTVGDRVLRIAGERLRRAVRGSDLVGRLGGDEFVVLAFDTPGPSSVKALTEHLRESLTRPITVDGRRLHVDASIGIVVAEPGDERNADDLVRDADVAMYQAKTLGRGRFEFFDVQLRERVQRRLRLEQDLRDAVRLDKLWAAYQPVVDLRSNRTVAVEGLLRWTHPVHGAVSPTEFIPLAEESDLINLLGTYVLRETTHELAARRAEGLEIDLKINLSTRQLDDPTFVPAVAEALEETGLPPKALCLEITESALMRDSHTADDALSALRGLGVRLAIDDFGTGYSSLAQLQRLTLDTLKIDRSFVTGLGTSSDAAAIVTSIIAMAHAVELTVVAEGVENETQLELLRELGCDQAQGFYLGKPLPAGELWGIDE